MVMYNWIKDRELKLFWKSIAIYVTISCLSCGVSLGSKSFRGDGYGLNYTLPMFTECTEKEHPNGSMVQTIPKLITAASAKDACPVRRSKLGIPPGYRVCRFPDCEKNICENGWCEETMESFLCHCFSGDQGKHCIERENSTKTDGKACDSNPCQNEGTCLEDLIYGYYCTCMEGFIGFDCEIDGKACDSNPCQNKGTCLEDLIYGYYCTCKEGFSGLDCEIEENKFKFSSTEENDCDSNPCQNEGVCDDMGSGYICSCMDGFSGLECEIRVNECDSNPCQNEGVCDDLVNGYICSCSEGFSGLECEIQVNECDSNPCQNEGVCDDLVNGYICSCSEGFSGLQCEIQVNECDSNPCQNEGVCDDLVNSYICSCSEGFSGLECEIQVNECDSRPCQNEGVCSDMVNGYICTCLGGFSGRECENDIDECESYPCTNGGSCHDLQNAYDCIPPPCEGHCIEFPIGDAYTLNPYEEISFISPGYPSFSSANDERVFTVRVDNSQFSATADFHYIKLHIYFLSEGHLFFLFHTTDRTADMADFVPITVEGNGQPPFELSGYLSLILRFHPTGFDCRLYFKLTAYPLYAQH